MGVSGSLADGNVSAEIASVVNSFIQEQGGVSGLVNQFEKQGLGPVIKSWVGNGDNAPITAAQIYRALGFETLQQLGAKLGISPDETAAKLSELLPNAIDKLTANGLTRPRWGWRYT